MTQNKNNEIDDLDKPATADTSIYDTSQTDLYDRTRRRIMWMIPNGLFMLGTKTQTSINLMTLSWVTQVSSEPKIVVISCEKESLSYKNIKDSSCFAISILTKADKKPAIVFAKPAIHDDKENTLSGYNYLEGEITKCPIISIACAYLEFKVTEIKEFESHCAIFGEVVNAKELFASEQRVTKDMILSMQDTKMNYGG